MIQNALITCFVFGMIILFTNCGNSQRTIKGESRDQKVSERLELIKLSDLSGKTIHLHEYSGKPIFLNFWASWCPPCKNELLTIEEATKHFNDDIVFLMASVEEPSKIIKYKEDHKLNLHFVRLDIPYIDAFVIKLPTTLLFDRNGTLILEEEGYRNWSEPQNLRTLKKLLE
jgi:thiol-disulfide isomerase/thioredoxin